jgi:hypothetical protein
MRVNLLTRPSDRWDPTLGTIPINLTIKPACGLPGDYDCQIDCKALMRLLRLQSDLPTYTLELFEKDLRSLHPSKLMGVELNDFVLTKIGYFID